MKSYMSPAEHQQAVRRALHLGRSGDPAGLPELIELSRLPSNEVQRLSASANLASWRTLALPLRWR